MKMLSLFRGNKSSNSRDDIIPDDDDIEPIDIALYIGAGFLGLLIVVLLIKGLLKYCLANGMKDMEVDDEMVKHAKDFDRKIQTVFN